MGKEIYMQRTIDYIARTSPGQLSEMEKKGVPEVVELLDGEGNVKSIYYKYED